MGVAVNRSRLFNASLGYPAYGLDQEHLDHHLLRGHPGLGLGGYGLGLGGYGLGLGGHPWGLGLGHPGHLGHLGHPGHGLGGNPLGCEGHPWGLAGHPGNPWLPGHPLV